MSITRTHLTAVLATVALVHVAFATAPALAGDQCSLQSFSPRPAWISSAIWQAEGNGILAVDAVRSRLILYSANGEGRVVPQPEGEYPALLTTVGGRLLVKLVGRNVASLDASSLADHQRLPLLDHVTTPLGSLDAVYQWAGVEQADGEPASVLAFGLVRGANIQPRGYQPGLFRMPATGSSTADLLLPVTAWDYYLLAYPYLTSIKSTGYFLDLDNGEAHLLSVPPGAAKPVAVPNGVPPAFRAVPAISAKLHGPKDSPALYDKLATLKMITGVYGDPYDGKVYLLGRDPVPAKGSIDWWLFRVDPARGVEAHAKLPTHAEHLSMVISPGAFFLIERGKVNAFGGQDIQHFVTVPTDLLQQALLQGTSVCPSLAQ